MTDGKTDLGRVEVALTRGMLDTVGSTNGNVVSSRHPVVRVLPTQTRNIRYCHRPCYFGAQAGRLIQHACRA